MYMFSEFECVQIFWFGCWVFGQWVEVEFCLRLVVSFYAQYYYIVLFVSDYGCIFGKFLLSVTSPESCHLVHLNLGDIGKNEGKKLNWIPLLLLIQL